MNDLVKNIDKLHTTWMGELRIKKNLHIDTDVIEYCMNKILDKGCVIIKNGKNYYCAVDNIVITVNAESFTIITAKRA